MLLIQSQDISTIEKLRDRSSKIDWWILKRACAFQEYTELAKPGHPRIQSQFDIHRDSKHTTPISKKIPFDGRRARVSDEARV